MPAGIGALGVDHLGKSRGDIVEIVLVHNGDVPGRLHREDGLLQQLLSIEWR